MRLLGSLSSLLGFFTTILIITLALIACLFTFVDLFF